MPVNGGWLVDRGPGQPSEAATDLMAGLLYGRHAFLAGDVSPLGHDKSRSGPYFDGVCASDTSIPALSEGVKPNRAPIRSITSAASFAIRHSGFTTWFFSEPGTVRSLAPS